MPCSRTLAARDAITMIREGVFRGLSVEFAGAKSSGGRPVFDSLIRRVSWARGSWTIPSYSWLAC